jgi:hypothetical protein
MSETSFSPGLQRWARRRGEHMADQFLRDHADRVPPGEYFEQVIASERLLSSSLRAAAHDGFMGRIVERETGQ